MVLDTRLLLDSYSTLDVDRVDLKEFKAIMRAGPAQSARILTKVTAKGAEQQRRREEALARARQIRIDKIDEIDAGAEKPRNGMLNVRRAKHGASPRLESIRPFFAWTTLLYPYPLRPDARVPCMPALGLVVHVLSCSLRNGSSDQGAI